MEKEPSIITIFGGGGDLTWRKLIPALYNLYLEQKLPPQFAVILVDGKAITEPQMLTHLQKGVSQFSAGKLNPSEWKTFSENIHYLKGDFKKPETYKKLNQTSKDLQKKWNQKAHTIFYMATPPSLFGVIPHYLQQEGMSQDLEYNRLVCEKPIGYDLETAKSLNQSLNSCFDESQVFRIDHYLGKETVQNILAFRFANPLFEPVWNRRYIDYITITVGEAVGVEERGGYYDHAGALRDMVQNHLMQLLCLVGMEPMLSFDANEIRNKKVDVLNAVREISPDKVHESAVRGQYYEGRINGKKVPGFRDEDGVAPDSQTDTFVALKFFIDNWRWQGVPFYMRTGKRMEKRASEISIHFRAVPHHSFPPEASLNWMPARLIISIQPVEGITLRFQAKYPGPEMHLRAADMIFNYQNEFHTRIPEAYETLLADILENNQTLFMRSDQIEASWKLLTPILEMWKKSPPHDFPNYPAGTWGPDAANNLLAQEGHSWPHPTDLDH